MPGGSARPPSQAEDEALTLMQYHRQVQVLQEIAEQKRCRAAVCLPKPNLRK